MKIEQKGELVMLTFPSFKDIGSVNHGFSTRLGGVSEGIYETMNLSFSVGDKYENVIENYRRIAELLGTECCNIVTAKQCHGTNVEIVTDDDRGNGITKSNKYTSVDGLITNIPGITLVTHYADCVPLLFVDPNKRVIATSHAGWRGTAGQVGNITIEKMKSEFGCDPKDILVGIAPSIGRCCYEVDEPVMSKMRAIEGVDISTSADKKENGKYMLDLKDVNRKIIMGAGVPNENITVSDICTCCNSNILHSHRATGGRRGCLGAFIMLKPEAK